MRVETVFKLLRREFWKVNIMQACLDSIALFLTSNLILFLFSVEIVAGFSNLLILAVLSSIFFGLNLIYRSRKYNIEIYEEKNPELNEILRTARDNLNSRDAVSQAMFEELMERFKSVTSESIVPSSTILKKIFLVGSLSFLTVFSGIADFQVAEIEEELIDDLGGLEDIMEEDEIDSELNDASEIMGEEKDIQGSDTLIDYSIEGEGERAESDFGDMEEGSEDPIFESSDPETDEDLQLAKEYSLAIRNFETD